MGVSGSGFRVGGVGCRVCDSGFRAQGSHQTQHSFCCVPTLELTTSIYAAFNDCAPLKLAWTFILNVRPSIPKMLFDYVEKDPGRSGV